MDKQLRLILCFLFIVSVSFGQDIMRATVGVTGSSSALISGDKTYLVQQSVGQSSVIGTFKTEQIVLRQGFIQPPIKVTSVGLGTTNLDAVVYPNPFTSQINVVFNEAVKETLSFVIYDMLGRKVYGKDVKATQQVAIDLEFLSNAQYVLLITSERKQFKATLLKR